jgi:hypothetical protein
VQQHQCIFFKDNTYGNDELLASHVEIRQRVKTISHQHSTYSVTQDLENEIAGREAQARAAAMHEEVSAPCGGLGTTGSFTQLMSNL